MVPKLCYCKNRTDTRIYVRGDKNINYGRVLEVMGTLSGAGFSKVALIWSLIKIRCVMVKKFILFSIFSHTNDSNNIFNFTLVLREPIDLPPIVSVELIQISDKTSIPFAPKKLEKSLKKQKRRMTELFQSKSTPPLKQKKTR